MAINAPPPSNPGDHYQGVIHDELGNIWEIDIDSMPALAANDPNCEALENAIRHYIKHIATEDLKENDVVIMQVGKKLANQVEVAVYRLGTQLKNYSFQLNASLRSLQKVQELIIKSNVLNRQTPPQDLPKVPVATKTPPPAKASPPPKPLEQLSFDELKTKIEQGYTEGLDPESCKNRLSHEITESRQKSEAIQIQLQEHRDHVQVLQKELTTLQTRLNETALRIDTEIASLPGNRLLTNNTAKQKRKTELEQEKGRLTRELSYQIENKEFEKNTRNELINDLQSKQTEIHLDIRKHENLLRNVFFF